VAVLRRRALLSAAFQNAVSVLAVVSGASTAGECAAAGMQTRCAPSLLAMRFCVAGAQASSFSPYRTRMGAPASSASAAVWSGQLSKYLPMASRPSGELRSIRSRRNAMIGPGTPAATDCGSCSDSHSWAIRSARPLCPAFISSASMARSTVAR
jgi:hypothetical protein